MRWLVAELAEPSTPEQCRIVVMHHPIVSSSAKHREHARDLWRLRFEERALPDILADGRVDLVLTGHTHTYERFRLHRSDGREVQLVNLSGRPRESVLWFGASAREARDLRGREKDWLTGHGWTELERWEIHQEEAMLGEGSNQFALFTAEEDGRLHFRLSFTDPEKAGDLREQGPLRIR